MLTPEQERELREAIERYPHNVHTDKGCLYVEFDRVGTIYHDEDDIRRGAQDVHLASRLVKCSRLMPAALDALDDLRGARDQLRRERDAAIACIRGIAQAEMCGDVENIVYCIDKINTNYPHLFDALRGMDAFKRFEEEVLDADED